MPHDDGASGGYPHERIDATTVIDGMMSMWSVAAVDDGLVAAGWSAIERAAWFSPDGLDWVRIDEYDDIRAGIGLGEWTNRGDRVARFVRSRLLTHEKPFGIYPFSLHPAGPRFQAKE